MSHRGILGPIFSENTINPERITDMNSSDTLLVPTRLRMRELSLLFGCGTISKGLRTPRSPDLSLPHFFFQLSYIEDNAYLSNPRNLDELKATYAASLPLFHPWRCRLCLQTRFIVQHTFGTVVNKLYCKHLTLNKVSRFKSSSYFSYEIRQNGPGSLIRDIINIPNIRFSNFNGCILLC
jgi:hypothetical protein